MASAMKTLALLSVWIVVSFAALTACSALTAQSCDPQTAYNQCDVPQGSGPGNR